MAPHCTVYNEAFFSVINKDFKMITLSNDCLFTEGPIWHPEGFYLFSDTEANCIYQIDENGNRTTWLENSGTDHIQHPDLNSKQAGSNGLAWTEQGVLICQHGSHAIARKSNKLEVLISEYQGRPFNSPNDLIVHSDGSIYFSDPPYGLKEARLQPEKYQPRAGVYHWHNGDVKLICDLLNYPNGVCLSPDENMLYICSHKLEEKRILKYALPEHRYMGILAEENSDGIEVDANGNFYLFNTEGIIVLDKQGMRLGKIELEAPPANGCWGGSKKNDMLVTARHSVLLFKNFLKA